MSDQSILLREDKGEICELILNRPKAHNSLSKDLLLRLLEEFKKIEKEIKIKIVIISANGPSFCSGHDLKEIKNNPDKNTYKNLFELCSKVMLSIISLSKPVIAKVHSTATAAGCQLVATCDLAVAAENAKFATPGVNIGLFCSTPMVALTRNLSKKHSMEMLLTGEMIDAHQAKDFGLINRVVNINKLDDTVNNLASLITSKSSKTVAIGKRAFYQQLELGITDAYKYTSEVMTQNMLSVDAQEGVDAFIQKRPPVWEN
tara:strand:- start:1696 stop:2475 length:780 start_codon:yes stop_codon:yes gene_type:complete